LAQRRFHYSSFPKYVHTFPAADFPIADSSSGSGASRSFFTEPKCLSNLAAVFSPMPGMSWSSVLVKSFERWLRWKVMANRWASLRAG
jgi:hypothetical protein